MISYAAACVFLNGSKAINGNWPALDEAVAAKNGFAKSKGSSCPGKNV
jgi:hypothetical protein